MKILWLDVETTGLDHTRNEILTMSGIVEIGGMIVEEFDFKLRPTIIDDIDEALKVNGITVEEALLFPPPKEACDGLTAVMAKYVDKYNKDDKFILAGQNVQFDKNFLRSLWTKQQDKYFGSWFWHHTLDTMTAAMMMQYIGKLDVPNFKLATLAANYSIEYDAHNSMADIRCTRQIMMKMLDVLQ